MFLNLEYSVQEGFRLGSLRRNHRIFSQVQQLSGWGYDSKTGLGLSTTTTKGKEKYLKAHPDAVKFMHQKMPGFDILDSMWKSTQATGHHATSGASSSKPGSHKLLILSKLLSILSWKCIYILNFFNVSSSMPDSYRRSNGVSRDLFEPSGEKDMSCSSRSSQKGVSSSMPGSCCVCSFTSSPEYQNQASFYA